MKYQYLTVLNSDPNGKHFRRPVVDVEIFGPKNSISTFALLDSGADNCLFHFEYAKAIGIDLDKCKKSATMGVEGGKIEIYLTEIQIKVKGLEKIKVPVGFIKSNSVNGLLGQIGFFDLNRIKFERDHGVFEVNPIR
jgi:hypothetical protein